MMNFYSFLLNVVHMIKRFFCFLIFTSICLLSIYSQHSLQGYIYDKNQKVIPAATVRLLDCDSVFIKGVITDEKGFMQFDKLKPGAYVLFITCIGYTDLWYDFEMPDADYALPAVTLADDDVLLGEITVKGSTFIQKDGYLLVVPDRQQTRHSFSGYELLYNLMIPGLEVDRKTKAVTSSAGKVTLYINGVEADTEEIQNLNPKDIRQVEYHAMPVSGPFVGDAAAVNYITRVYKAGGYVRLDAEQTVGYVKGDYNLASKLVHGNTSYSFYGGYNMKEYGDAVYEKNEDLLLNGTDISRTSRSEGTSYENNQQYAQFKVAHDTEKHNLSATASFVRDATPRNGRADLLEYAGGYAQTGNSLNETDEENMQGALRLNGVFNLGKQRQLKFRFNGSYARNHYDRRYEEAMQTALSGADEDLYAFDAQVAYRHEIDARNSFYGRVTHFHNVTSSSYTGDYPSWQHLWKGETLFQADYMHLFSKRLAVVVSPGASWLNYKLHTEGRQQTLNLRFNTSVRYVFPSGQWAGLGVSLGNNQPDISYLNTSTQTVDLFRIKRGNPELDNTRILTVFSMYEGALHPLLNLQARVSYVHNSHNVYMVYYQEADKIVSSFASADDFNAVNAELAVSSRFSDRLRTSLKLKYACMYVPGVSELERQNFSCSFDVNYFIGKFAVNAFVKSPEKLLNQSTLAFVRTPASYGISLRYSGKNWMAEVGVDNPFSRNLRYRESARYGVYSYNLEQKDRISQQSAYVKMAWTLNFGKKTKYEADEVDRRINSAILKINK